MGKRHPITFILIILALGYGGSIFWLNNGARALSAVSLTKITRLS